MSLFEIKNEAESLATRWQELEKRARALGPRATALAEAAVIGARDAAKIIRESQQPMRVGVVGAFSAGKTRLLETLFGCAGRLKGLVDEKPTSGNIVEFELRAGNGQETQLDEWKVEFMDELRDAGRMLRRLLLEARNEQNRERTPELDRLLDQAEFNEDRGPRWPEAEQWALQAHALARGQLKVIAFEVYRMAYTVNLAKEWLGRTLTLRETDAYALMTLSEDRSHYDQALGLWKRPFGSAPAEGSQEMPALSVEQLKSLFPIVRKIHVRVTLPPFIAEMFGNPKHLAMRVVDCPGADADESNFRDAVICAYELQDVDTVLVLINGQRPGQKRAFLGDLLRLWGPQAKDRILAVVSRFDLLPIKDPHELERMKSEVGPLSSRELMQSISNFDTLYSAALHTVLDKDVGRVCLVSTLAHLTAKVFEDVGKTLRGTLKFYADELRYAPNVEQSASLEAEMEKLLQLPWVESAGTWQLLANRLKEAGDRESQNLSELLLDYSLDGGFRRLHEKLREYKNRAGATHMEDRLNQQMKSLKDRAKMVEDGLAAIPAKAVPPPPTPTAGATPALPSAHEVIHELAKRFSLLATQVSSDGKRFPLERQPPGKENAESVLPPIKRWLIAEIYRWEEWRLHLPVSKKPPRA